jgi:hypothetical protein
MVLYDKSQLRITPWPREGIPLPTTITTVPRRVVDAHGNERLDSVQRAVMDRMSTTNPGPPIPTTRLALGQLYLKVVNTDLRDRRQVERLLAEVGGLGLEYYQGGIEIEYFQGGGSYGSPFTFYVEYFREYEDMMADEYAAEELTFDPELEEPLWSALASPDGEPGANLDQYLACAGLIQDAVTIKRILIDQDPHVPKWRMLDILAHDEPIWDNHTYQERGGDISALLDEPVRESLATLLDRLITPALAPFGPRLIETGRITYPELTDSADAVEIDRWKHAPVYSIMMAELFNHIVLDAPTRRCAKCNQLFVHQQGRAIKGTNRSRGVLYCTASCARAAAQRAYRARKRASARS